MSTQLLGLSDIEAAAIRIAPYARRTPVLFDERLDALAGCTLRFKCENLQRIGAFKFRGACNAVFALDAESAIRGVLTHSSGNHGAALAEAARLRGIPAHVVVPEGAPAIKLDNIAAGGAIVHRCAPTLADRERAAAELMAATGASLIHPYEHAQVIAGQGTAAYELLTDHPELDVLMMPLGGGGLAAGSTLAARAMRPGLTVIAVEPAGADDGYQGLKRGQRLTDWPVDTVCDGLRTMLGAPNFEILSRERVDVVTVPDPDTLAARTLLERHLRLRVEPSSAIVLAAVLADPQRFRGARIGVILSGGNVA